jgi:hypothetical protein
MRLIWSYSFKWPEIYGLSHPSIVSEQAISAFAGGTCGPTKVQNSGEVVATLTMIYMDLAVASAQVDELQYQG